MDERGWLGGKNMHVLESDKISGSDRCYQTIEKEAA